MSIRTTDENNVNNIKLMNNFKIELEAVPKGSQAEQFVFLCKELLDLKAQGHDLAFACKVAVQHNEHFDIHVGSSHFAVLEQKTGRRLLLVS